MILKILSKRENVKPLLLNSTTSNLLCVCEQRESRLVARRTREIRGAWQFSWLRFYALQAHATFWMLKNSRCWRASCVGFIDSQILLFFNICYFAWTSVFKERKTRKRETNIATEKINMTDLFGKFFTTYKQTHASVNGHTDVNRMFKTSS